MRSAIALALLALAACGTQGSPGTNGDDQPGTDAGSNSGSDGGSDGGSEGSFVPPAGYTRLLGRTWSLAAGETDTYKCVRVTLTEDTYLTNIIAQAPNGSHHAVLSIAGANNTSGADGEYNCNVGANGMVMLFASGVGTSPLDFPAGVGVKIAAGTQISLNLHLFNATDDALSGESAVWVKSSATPPSMLAEMVFAGTVTFNIPSNNQPYTANGGCTASSPYTLFALWPHMHQVATHTKFELTHNGTTTTLLDEPYSFTEQKYWPQTPEVQVAQGDDLKVTCTWQNNTGTSIHWGDSSTAEMCFTGLYRYPAKNSGLFDCTNGGF